MSTTTLDTDPGTPTRGTDLRTYVGPAEIVSQTLTLAWRATMKMRRNFEQLFDVTIQPLLFTAMFAYIFGGAISGSVDDYLPIIIPGLIGQTVLTACVATGVQLREDMDKGVFDRFKVLPISRIAPLAGPMAGCPACWRRSSWPSWRVGRWPGSSPGSGPSDAPPRACRPSP